jgi:ketosteroid isomerase-like protein
MALHLVQPDRGWRRTRTGITLAPPCIGAILQRALPGGHASGARQPATLPDGVPMPTAETLERFIAQVEANAHVEACQDFYDVDSTMQENQSPPRVGRDAHVAAERKVMARVKSLRSQCVRPVFMNGDRVVIRWIFEFEWLDGSVTRMDELSYQRWDGERIAEETFYYDPAQRTPQPAATNSPT